MDICFYVCTTLVTLICWFFAVRASIRNGMTFDSLMLLTFFLCFLPFLNCLITGLMLSVIIGNINQNKLYSRITDWFNK